MSESRRQPIGFVAWGGHTVAELRGVDRWSVRVNGREDARTAGNLAALYQGTYGGPSDGHYGYRILTDLADRMGGTWVFNQPPPRPGTVPPIGTSKAEFARGGGAKASRTVKPGGKAAYPRGKQRPADQKGCGRVAGRFAPGHTCGGSKKARDEGQEAGNRGLAGMLAKSRAAAAAKRAKVDAPKAAAKPTLREQADAARVIREKGRGRDLTAIERAEMLRNRTSERIRHVKGAGKKKETARLWERMSKLGNIRSAAQARADAPRLAERKEIQKARDKADRVAKEKAAQAAARAPAINRMVAVSKGAAKAKAEVVQARAKAAKKVADKQKKANARPGRKEALARVSAALERGEKIPRAEVARQVREYRAYQLAGGKSARKVNETARAVIRQHAASKPSTPAQRAAALKRMVDRSRVASGRAGAEAARRKQEAAGARPTKELERDLTSADPAVRRAAMDGILAKQRAGDAAAKERFGRKEVAKDLRKTGKAVEKARAKLDDAATEARVMGKAGAAKAVLGKLESMKAEAGARGAEAAARAKAAGERAAALKEKLAASKSAGRPAAPVSPIQVHAARAAALAALGPKPTNTLSGVGNDTPTRRWASEKQAIEARHVVPVPPPRPEILARPVTDPIRMKAEGEKMDQAFDRGPGASDNFVPLAAVRNAMPHLNRQEFDAVLNAKRDRGEVGLDSHEGLTHPAHPDLKAAAIREAGSELVYISRREGGRSSEDATQAAREAAYQARLKQASKGMRRVEQRKLQTRKGGSWK